MRQMPNVAASSDAERRRTLRALAAGSSKIGSTETGRLLR